MRTVAIANLCLESCFGGSLDLALLGGRDAVENILTLL